MHIFLNKSFLVLVPGSYIFVESSSPRRPNDNAILLSTLMQPSAQMQCMKFYFNMFGPNIGTLRVWTLLQGSGNSPVKVWELTGNQGTGWKMGQVAVGQNKPYQVSCFLLIFIYLWLIWIT